MHLCVILDLSCRPLNNTPVRTMWPLVAAVVLLLNTPCHTNAQTWSDVCDLATKTCGLYSGNTNLNTFADFLYSDNVMFDNGWTLLVSPCADSCDVTNCSAIQSSASCTDDDRFVWNAGVYFTRFNDITIRSAATGTRFYVRSDTTNVNNNSPYDICAGFIFEGSGVTFMEAEFSIESSCTASSRGFWAQDISAVQFVSQDATDSTVSDLLVTGAAFAVRMSPNMTSNLTAPATVENRPTINVEGTSFNDITVQTPFSDLSDWSPTGTVPYVVIDNFIGDINVGTSNTSYLVFIFPADLDVTTTGVSGATAAQIRNLTAIISVFGNRGQCPPTTIIHKQSEAIVGSVVGFTIFIIIVIIAIMIEHCRKGLHSMAHGMQAASEYTARSLPAGEKKNK